MENTSPSSAHTPGSWEFFDLGSKDGDLFVYDADSNFIANAAFIRQGTKTVDPKQTKRVARLIAAAPELLKACKLLDSTVKNSDLTTAAEDEEIEAILTKAEGR